MVDDERLNLRMLEDLLRSEGYGVRTAEDGEQALERVREALPDLILLDVMMPKLDGYEVCRRLKGDKDTVFIPIVMVTALTRLEEKIKGIEAGADDFLTKPFNSVELTTRVRSLLKVKHLTDELENAETVLFSLALGVEAKDPYTEGHCERLSAFSFQLGAAMGLPGEELTALRRGGVLHDIGKIMIPDTILAKPGKLSEDEWTIMREHPLIGERICKPLKTLKLVLPIIRHHHEKGDGSGYPDGLKGEEIPVTARILQVVDVYDALTTKRPYKPGLPQERVFEIMLEEAAKGWWDRRILEAFLQLTRKGKLRPPDGQIASPVAR
ncbi:MAG: HD-GYP domain-containing protein [Candidatus Methylomirabilales bacterium]